MSRVKFFDEFYYLGDHYQPSKTSRKNKDVLAYLDEVSEKPDMTTRKDKKYKDIIWEYRIDEPI